MFFTYAFVLSTCQENIHGFSVLGSILLPYLKTQHVFLNACFLGIIIFLLLFALHFVCSTASTEQDTHSCSTGQVRVVLFHRRRLQILNTSNRKQDMQNKKAERLQFGVTLFTDRQLLHTLQKSSSQ